jgi:hypothetical protein
MGRTTSRGGGSSETYTKCLSSTIPELNDMTEDQVLDVKGDCDVGGTFYVGGGGVSITVGTGAPSATAAKGSLYIRTDGSADSLLYVNTDGSTSWAAFDNV